MDYLENFGNQVQVGGSKGCFNDGYEQQLESTGQTEESAECYQHCRWHYIGLWKKMWINDR